MRFGIALFPLRPTQMAEVAVAAESLGFDSVWIGEHVISPNEIESRYPYHDDADGPPAFHSRLPFYDPYAALSYLAALTRRVQLVLAVSIVPLHDPYHLARSVMTLDHFSNGRFQFGVGAGWLREEFEVVGAPWQGRGSRMEEMLDLMLRLWNDDTVEFHGRFFDLPPSAMEPKPLTRPHPPFVFGGSTPVALRRTAELGEGWYGVGLDVGGIGDCVDEIGRLRAGTGRTDPVEISIAWPPYETLTVDTVESLADVGVDRIVVRPWQRGRDAVDAITAFAERFGLEGDADG
jgi:probable F420-dependent oxidoreductase